MPKARKRKVPVTTTSNHSGNASSSKPQASRTVIRQFHVLLKQQAQLNDAQKLAEIQRQIDELGGIDCYQSMSAIGQGKDRGGGSEKVLIGWLKELGCGGQKKLKLLEVGALLPDNYKSCSSWIDATPMDLHSRHPSIIEQDFLLMDEAENCEKWDIISLSLVLNFVPRPENRGRMLRLAHSMLPYGGKLFLALPLPCVTNSRYLDFDRLRDLMRVVGFVEVKQRWKETGKMAYWLYTKEDPIAAQGAFTKKSVLRQGNRNNFCVLL
ncbi:nucleolus protein [Guyanagaster necrorhizus]|uniref:25S rRNA adenine-N(1) methyltransferase n=1 Tax=Guyanagaster necrorhizus TaxID=856835 RepID=A0A9P7W3S6_9AGAR|nr:nucleolus protein [Guyanagaster necrorhizus MCA 3950]KAG7452881.1 nucleolus protein [Guyanagaster necrorhizus MCA 3950]